MKPTTAQRQTHTHRTIGVGILLAFLALALFCSGPVTGNPGAAQASEITGATLDATLADEPDNRTGQCQQWRSGLSSVVTVAGTATPHPPTQVWALLPHPMQLVAPQRHLRQTHLTDDRGSPRPPGPLAAHPAWPNAPPV